MSRRQLREPRRLALRCCLIACSVAISTMSMAACATTVDDTGQTPATPEVGGVPVGAEPAPDSGETIDGGTIVDPDAPPPTVATTGSAADLLPDLATEMSRLGSQIAEGGDAKDTLVRIEQIWERVAPEIETERAELLEGFTATIEMARIGVERKRPADADKAFALLTDLVDRFATG